MPRTPNPVPHKLASWKLPTALIAEIKECANGLGVTQTDWVRDALTDALHRDWSSVSTSPPRLAKMEAASPTTKKGTAVGRGKAPTSPPPRAVIGHPDSTQDSSSKREVKTFFKGEK